MTTAGSLPKRSQSILTSLITRVHSKGRTGAGAHRMSSVHQAREEEISWRAGLRSIKC